MLKTHMKWKMQVKIAKVLRSVSLENILKKFFNIKF